MGRPGSLTAHLQDLFQSFGEDVDAEVVEYLNAAFLEAGDSDTDELSDAFAGFSPGFAALPALQQRQRVEQLQGQARELEEGAEAGQRQGRNSTPHGADLAEALAQLSTLSVQDMATWAPTCFQAPQFSEEQHQAVAALAELCQQDGISNGFLAHVLAVEGGHRLEDAAVWIVDCPDLAAAHAVWQQAQQQRQLERQREALEKQAVKQDIVQRFHLQAVHSSVDCKSSKGKPHAPRAWGSSCGSENRVRYRDGVKVSMKGERYIVERLGEEWDGGSRGRVYTKGKRGKGFV